MSAPGTTPGLWASFEFGGSHMGGEVGLGVCVAGKSIDAMMGDHDALVCILPDPQAQANAHLIAAAPDLYAELEKARNFIAQSPQYRSEGHTGAASIVESSGAILAKARGES